MAEIHWANPVNGSFTDAADWTGGVVPGSADDAILDATGATPYTVTASAGATVTSIQTAANATLDISGASFDATAGTGSGANAGLIFVGSDGALVAQGAITNTGTVSLNASGQFASLNVINNLTLTGGGEVILSDDSGNQITDDCPNPNPPPATLTNVDNTIAGAGSVGDGILSVVNDAMGVIDATGTSNVLEIDIGATFANAGLIETTGVAGMAIGGGTTPESGSIVNTGSIEAVGAGALTIGPATIDNEHGAIGVTKGATLDLDAGGTLAGAGTLSVVDGTAAINAFSTLAISNVMETGNTATVTFGTANFAYAGLWAQTAGTLAASSGDRVNFTGSGDGFSGTLSGAGTIAFIGGSDTLSDVHVTVANPVINGATVTLSGLIDLSHTMGASTADLIIAAGGASLGAGGALVLTNRATNTVHGGTLTNVNDYIKGAGQLGDGAMVLVNEHGGIIDGDDSLALIINTGSSTIINAGGIEAGSTGTTTVVSAVDNTGVLAAFAGTLTVEGAVTGAGKVDIDGGLAELASTFNQNVSFVGIGGGTLELAHSQAYTGEITGFSRKGATALDLADIAFVSGTTTASYSGTTASGVLTVVDGTHVARITLVGNYTRSTFTTSSDGHGGTTVIDPAAPASVQRFVALAAAIGGGPAGGVAPAHDGRPIDPPILARPGAAAALLR